MEASRLMWISTMLWRNWGRKISTVARVKRGTGSSLVRRPGVVMANVKKSNFWETYEQVRVHLQSADFVALDFEMTGIESAPWRRPTHVDTCEIRYQNVKHSAESFAVWQCGVCPFRWDEVNKKFVAYPYNFYIFPRNELCLENMPRNYYSQTSSLEFLAKHGFDFNTCIYHGISYLSREQEEMARRQLGLIGEGSVKNQSKLETMPDIPLTRTSDVVFSENTRVKIGQWRDSVLRNQKQVLEPKSSVQAPAEVDDVNSRRVSASEVLTDTIATKTEETSLGNLSMKELTGDVGNCSNLRPFLLLDDLGNNQARLVKQVIRKHYQDLVAVMAESHSAEDGQQIRIIYTRTKEDKANLMEELQQERNRKVEALVDQAVGFRKIIDEISASRKPIVGHNCLLDLAHLHSKFIAPLPSSASSFATSIREYFPCVFDTKYLLKTEPTLRGILSRRSTSLALAYAYLCQGLSNQAGIPGRFYNGKPGTLNMAVSRVKIEISPELQRYASGTDTMLKHEAGFDAYMTGAVFAQACHILHVPVDSIQDLPRAIIAGQSGFSSYANSLMLGTWKGQMALDLTTGKEAVGMRAPQGPQSPPHRLSDRSNVALVWGLPASDQEILLKRLVQNVFSVGKHPPVVGIFCLDEGSALLEFRSPAILDIFLRAIQCSMDVPTTSKSDKSETCKVNVSGFEAFIRICSSPLATERLSESADLLGLSHPSLLSTRYRVYRAEIPANAVLGIPGGVQKHDTLATKERQMDEEKIDMPETESGSLASTRIEKSSSLHEMVSKADTLGEGVTRYSNDGSDNISAKMFKAWDPSVRKSGKELTISTALQASHNSWMKRVFGVDEISKDPVADISSPTQVMKKIRKGRDGKESAGPA